MKAAFYFQPKTKVKDKKLEQILFWKVYVNSLLAKQSAVRLSG